MDADVTGAGREAADQGKRVAAEVEDNRPYQVLVKVGLVAYGIVHLVVAWLAVQLALGERSGEASNTGALRALAATPIGLPLMWAAGVGMLALVVWQLVAVAIGYREYDDGKRTRKRLSSAGRAVVYAALGIAAVRIALGASSSDDSASSVSAGLFGLPGGRIIVALIGLAVASYGVWTVIKGITGRYNEEIETELHGVRKALAAAGHVAKGVAFVVIGALFVWAAISYDAERAGGMGQALEAIRQQPAGTVLLLVTAVGIACYGIWCFFWALNAKHA